MTPAGALPADAPGSGKSSPKRPRSRPRASRRLLLEILALAFVLRVIGIDVTSYHPDEGNILKWVKGMLSQGTLEPQTMSYGTLCLYLQAGLLWLVEAVRALLGFSFPLTGRRAHTVLRTVSLVSSVATVALVPGLLRALEGEARSRGPAPPVSAGHLAAIFLSVAFLSVQCAHYDTVDSLLAFLTTAAVLWGLRAWQSRRYRHAALSGVLAGLAAGTKYTGLLALAPLVLGAIVCRVEARAGSERGRLRGWADRWRTVALPAAGVSAAMVAFFFAMPYAAIQPARLLEALRFESHHYATGNITQFAAGPNTFWWNLEFLYFTGLGPGLALMALFGLVLVVVRLSTPLSKRGEERFSGAQRGRRCNDLLFLVYPVVVLAFLARYVVRFDRNLLPVLPFAAVLAGVHAVETWRAVHRIRSARARRVGQGIWVAAVALSVLYPLSRDIVFDWEILQPHTRRQLKTWVRRLPEGVKVKRHGFQQKGLAWLQKHGYDYVVMSSHSWEPVAAQPERFKRLARQYQELFARCDVVAVFQDPWFASDFFAPHRLLNSATVNIYHGPTLMVLEVPKSTGRNPDGQGAPGKISTGARGP